jgi:hypothetical protein
VLIVLRQAVALYARIVRTYFGWAGTLLPLAAFVFIPLGLIHAIPVKLGITHLDFDGALHLFAAMAAVLALTVTGLLGEFFYTGAVAIALTHPRHGEQPALRDVARTINYRRLIAVDLLYAVLVALGFAAFVLPGILIYIYLGLAAPIVEIERHGIRAALSRSIQLVRGHFWLVFAVLVPLEIGGDAITNLAIGLSHSLLGDSLAAEWLADTATNIFVTPFYAVAAVLLTLDLIAAREGSTPRLHSSSTGVPW